MGDSGENPPSRRLGTAALVVGALMVGLLAGLAIPHPWRPGRAEPLTQEGTATVPAREASPDGVEVYYPTPFAAPPRLEFFGGLNGCAVAEQAANKFKLTNPGKGQVRIEWTAVGQPGR